MEQESREKNRLEELQEAIALSASAVESEFDRTANDWLSCLGTRIFIIETYLNSKKVEELLSPDKYQLALMKIEQLKERLYNLKQQYPEKKTVPPDEIKRELLDALNILK